MSKELLRVNFSGGRSSAMMAYIIKNFDKYDKYKKIFMFANTGKELEQTLKFVDQCDKHFGLDLVWVEAKVNPKKGKVTKYKIVDYKTASREGEPFISVIQKYGLPSRLRRHCTRELKIRPMDFYMKEFAIPDFKTAIGIRYDEPKRLRKLPNVIYPLNEFRITEFMVREFWRKMPFDLDLKDYEGNCDLCFLKSTRKKLTILAENPKIADWWLTIENLYCDDKQKILDVYRNRSINDLVEMAKNFDNLVIDSYESGKLQPNLFTYKDANDINCFCGI